MAVQSEPLSSRLRVQQAYQAAALPTSPARMCRKLKHSVKLVWTLPFPVHLINLQVVFHYASSINKSVVAVSL